MTGQYLWITTAAQMGMGFILPFALTFVAIPLETFVHSLRTVLGLTIIGFLRFVSLTLRVLGSVFLYAGMLVEHLYDLPLFIPLWLEERNSQGPGKTGSSSLREVTS
jgi:EamA domain-containing membrane protein RarD